MISDFNQVESKNQLVNACNESTYFTRNYIEYYMKATLE